MNYDIGNPLLSEKTVIKISFSRIIDIDKKEIFDVMANIEKYPTILPKNYVSVIIINQTNNTIFAEEEIMEKGIKTKLLVKHTIFPYEKHVLEVLSGDAENTIITEIYEDVNSSVRLTTDAEIHLQGILVPFGFLAQNNLEHAMNTAIDIFVEYTRNQTRD
jgi:hypothetical protein